MAFPYHHLGARNCTRGKEAASRCAEYARLYFEEGLSSIEIGERFSVAPTGVTAMLKRHGYTLRTNADALQLWHDKASQADRNERVKEAHKAVPIKRAQRANSESVTEERLYNLLKGVEPLTKQRLIGSFNVDMATDTVSVEVSGGSFDGCRSALDRTRSILDAGFHMIEIVCSKSYPFHAASAQQVIAFFEHTKRLPARIREYRVVRGSGELLSVQRLYSDDGTFI